MEISSEDEEMSRKKILITGFAGFVAHYFIDYLYEQKIEAEVWGIDIKEPTFDTTKYREYLQIHFEMIDMVNVNEMKQLFESYIPDYVLHLAAYSSVAYSWKNPSESFLNNTIIFLNLIKQVQEYNPSCRVLSVGSSEEYGNVEKSNLPIREDQGFEPISPYAVARVSQEMLSKIYVDNFGLDIILTRSFNHIGPRQDERFVVPSFVSRIVDIKKRGDKEGIIETGDISVIRDFVDVRDVVRAYYMLLKKGRKGEVYNVCSGHATSLEDLIYTIADLVGVRVSTKINPEYVRPKDNKVIVGSPFKIETEIGWKAEITIMETIKDMIRSKEACEK